MIEIYATLASVNGYKVRLFLTILGIDFVLNELDMYAGEHKKEPFLHLNPFGQMPAMRDNEYVIADSHACLTYLARKYGGEYWLPSDAEGMAKVSEWMSKSANEIHQGPWMARAKMRRPEAVTISNEEIHNRCDLILKLMDEHLSSRQWLAAENVTIADLSCFAPISILTDCGYDTHKWANVSNWLEQLRKLDGAIDIDGNKFI